jgi:hypothetical protein
MVIRNSTSRYSPFEEDDDEEEEEENENDEDFPPTPPSSPVLTSQQSQASKYSELDKFTKQWENYQVKRNQYLERKKNRQKRKRIDETEEQRHARLQNANNSKRIRKNQFTKEQLQLFRLQKRDYQRMRRSNCSFQSLSIESEIQNLLIEDHIQLIVQVLLLP